MFLKLWDFEGQQDWQCTQTGRKDTTAGLSSSPQFWAQQETSKIYASCTFMHTFTFSINISRFASLEAFFASFFWWRTVLSTICNPCFSDSNSQIWRFHNTRRVAQTPNQILSRSLFSQIRWRNTRTCWVFKIEFRRICVRHKILRIKVC